MLTERKIKGIDIFLPWIESSGLVVYCYLMVLFNIKFQPPVWIACFFFLPLAGFEFCLSVRYGKKHLLSVQQVVFLSGRVVFLFLFFYLWSVLFLQVMHASYSMIYRSWMIVNAPYWSRLIKFFLYARPKIVMAMLTILFISYYTFFLRMKRGRFFTSIVLPWLLIFTLFFIFYNDILGGVSKKKVESQPDVRIFFQYPTADFAKGKPSSPIDISKLFGVHSSPGMPRFRPTFLPNSVLNTFKFPRSLRIDEERGKLYLSFGCTLGDASGFPNFLEIDIATKDYRALRLPTAVFGQKVIRDFGFLRGSKKLYLSPWGSDFNIYGISQKTFKVIEKIDIGHRPEIKHWEPYDVFYDNKTESVYIANGLNPLLIAYHLRDGKVEIIDLVREGIAGIGSTPNKIRFSVGLNKLYMLVIADKKRTLLVELKTVPLKILRIIRMPELAVSMEVDEDNKTLLVTSGFGNQLWEINLEKFEIIKKISSPVVCCRKILLDNANNLLYCLDYLRGRVFIIERDTGKIHKKYWVGNKPLGMVKFGERIFVASTLGIIEIKPDLGSQDK